MKQQNPAINNLHRVDINNSKQWILVRGKNSEGPLVIHVQAGPGLPMISEANTMEELLDLEKSHLVAYWDQRGCGKSFQRGMDPKTINFAQLTDDLIVCTQFLLSQYKKNKAVLVGYSIGATISLMAAVKNKNLFRQLFLVGIDIDIPFANKYALKFAMHRAQSLNNKKFVKQIKQLEETSIINAKQFQKWAKILTDLGGIKTGSRYNQLLMSTMKNLIFTRAYRLSDILKTLKGMQFSQNALLPEMDTLNLYNKIKRVDVPVYFIQGKLDAVAPFDVAVNFYNYLQAEHKTFVEFERSAHMPHYEGPKRFSDLLKKTIANGTRRQL